MQPHGCLVATDAAGRMVWRSANADAILATRLPAQGEPLAAAPFEGQATVLEVIEAASRTAPGVMHHRELALHGGPADVIVHSNGACIVAEFEPRSGPGDARRFAMRAHESLGVLRQQRSIGDLLEAAVLEVRRLTGFDRVMAYRFRHDASGDIVAEARRDDLEAFLGRRYPASDIPAQARRLYVINTLRLIVDVQATPVPVSGTRPEPLDLSWSTLRSVSPVHIEYLTNMGVKASMSVSIVVDGKLWGMLACHHMAPRHVPWDVRMACDVLAQLLASAVQALLGQDRATHAAAAAQLRTRLVEQRVLGDDTPSRSLRENAGELLEAFGAHALAVSEGGEVFATGGLQPAQAAQLMEWLRSERGRPMTAVSASADLPAVLAAALPGWCGLLAVCIDHTANDWLALLRREQVETIHWGGKPEKNYVTGPLGPRLTPRGSFALWRETVRGSAVPWTDFEQAQARDLGDDLARAASARQAELARARDQMLAILGHDLRNPLQTISVASQLLGRGGDSVQLGQRIQRSSSRMQHLIGDLLDMSRLQSGLGLGVERKPADLARLVHDSVQEARMASPGLVVQEDLPGTLVADIDMHRVAQLLDNLLGNARQHGAPGQPLRVVLRGEGDRLLLTVANHAPPIAPETVAQLFNPFKPRSVGNERNPGGLGLGLYIASEIARGHDGTLRYGYEGGEVEFTFSAPLH